jgi:hypothetical protein
VHLQVVLSLLRGSLLRPISLGTGYLLGLAVVLSLEMSHFLLNFLASMGFESEIAGSLVSLGLFGIRSSRLVVWLAHHLLGVLCGCLGFWVLPGERVRFVGVLVVLEPALVVEQELAIVVFLKQILGHAGHCLLVLRYLSLDVLDVYLLASIASALRTLAGLGRGDAHDALSFQMLYQLPLVGGLVA